MVRNRHRMDPDYLNHWIFALTSDICNCSVDYLAMATLANLSANFARCGGTSQVIPSQS